MFILMIFLLAVEIDQRSLVDRDLIFEEKRQKAIEIELDCDFIKISVNNMKNDYDLDYEIMLYRIIYLVILKIKK